MLGLKGLSVLVILAQSSVPSIYIAAQNFSLMRSNTLFWYPRVPDGHMSHRNIYTRVAGDKHKRKT